MLIRQRSHGVRRDTALDDLITGNGYPVRVNGVVQSLLGVSLSGLVLPSKQVSTGLEPADQTCMASARAARTVWSGSTGALGTGCSSTAGSECGTTSGGLARNNSRMSSSSLLSRSTGGVAGVGSTAGCGLVENPSTLSRSTPTTLWKSLGANALGIGVGTRHQLASFLCDIPLRVRTCTLPLRSAYLRPPDRLDSISRPHVIGLAAVITSSRELLREERVLAA